MAKPEVSILLATYNEAENIRSMIDGVLSVLPEHAEVIVVDDNSPDGTAEVVGAHPDPRVILVRRTARGLASAYLRGLIESRAPVVGWLDSDLAMRPDTLRRMIELSSHHDVVVGSRYVEGGDDLRTPYRVWASRAVNTLAEKVLGGGIRDYDSGFLVIRRTVLDHVTFRMEGHGEYCMELLYAARRAGLSICEVGYVFSERPAGESKSAPDPVTFLMHGARYVSRIAETRYRHRRR